MFDEENQSGSLVAETPGSYEAITAMQIQDWKAKYGDVLSEIRVVYESTPSTVDGQPENEKAARFVAKIPDRGTIDLVGHHGQAKDVVKTNKALIANCILGGDMDLLNRHGGVYAQVLVEIGKLAKAKSATVKKL